MTDQDLLTRVRSIHQRPIERSLFRNKSIIEAKIERLATSGVPFTDADIYEIFENIDETKISEREQLSSILKTRLRMTKKVFEHYWRLFLDTTYKDSTALEDEETDWLYAFELSPQKTIIMKKDGIFIQKVSMIGNIVNATEEYIYHWNSFNIYRRYKTNAGAYDIFHYDIELDGNSFYDVDEKFIRGILFSHFTGEKGMAYINDVLRQMLNDEKVPDVSDKLSMVVGFTNDGWRLPPDYFFPRSDEVSLNVVKSLEKILRQHDEKDIKDIVCRLYENTSIQFKDIIFAWGMYAPFAYCLRQFMDLMIPLALCSGGDQGKSMISNLITQRFFGHMNISASDDVFHSQSMIQSLLCSSTFPIVLDDCENIERELVHLFKTYTTQDASMQKKGAGPGMQFYTVNKPYCTPSILNFNNPPSMLNDDNFRQRLIYLDIIQSTIYNPNWKKIYLSLPSGAVLRLLYEYTKSWTSDDVYSRYEKANDLAAAKGRPQKIAKALMFGGMIFEELFGIKLNLTNIPDILTSTKESYLSELGDMILYQVEAGKYIYREGDTYIYVPVSWVKHPVREYAGKGTPGVGLDTNNIIDIQSQYEGRGKAVWKLSIVVNKLRIIFPNVKLETNLILRTWDEDAREFKPKQSRCIYIPYTDLETYRARKNR